MRVKQVGAFVLDVLFPRRCAICGRVVGFTKGCGCTAWLPGLRLPPEPLPPPTLETLALRYTWACFVYEEPVRGALLRMKFEDAPELANPLGDELAERYHAVGLAGKHDIIVPVPASRKSTQKRGYNQSVLLARRLGGAAGLPVVEGALRKVAETAAQNTLNRAGRLTNLAGAFSAVPDMVADKRILLVDDIITTGSTLNECALSLMGAGALTVDSLCVAAAGVDEVKHMNDEEE